MLLKWLHGRIMRAWDEDGTTVAVVPTDPESGRPHPWQLSLMQALLQLLDNLLSGKPPVSHALCLLSTFAGMQSYGLTRDASHTSDCAPHNTGASAQLTQMHAVCAC